jgi:hypothetical protein
MPNWSSSFIRFTCVFLWMAAYLLPDAVLPWHDRQAVAAAGEIEKLPRGELSPPGEQTMQEEIQHNIEMLQNQGLLKAPREAQAVTYTFPLRLAPGQPDYAGFRVSAFADHNSTGGQVLDYNGGTRTYDSHRGTDYALWPFSWNKLDAGAVQVVAAAAGTIINKVNGDPTDHNCTVSSNDPWNYVTLLHSDGRLTIYGHMRYNSLTSKAVGQTVAQGEYLGTAASSGNSSGPHLHFEVRFGSFSTAECIDPYAGPNSQPVSLWSIQRPYLDSGINKLATHSAPPSAPDPCLPSTANLQDSFSSPTNIYFYTYYRDYQAALVTELNIYRPDGSIFQTWQDIPIDSNFYSGTFRAKVFAFSASDPAGTWRFEAVYNNQVYETFFNLNASPTLALGSPNGGELWEILRAYPITWTDNFGGDVNIALYRDGTYITSLVDNTPSDGEYLWIPGRESSVGTGYKIRVTSVLRTALFDESNAPFSLLPTPLTKKVYLPSLLK